MAREPYAFLVGSLLLDLYSLEHALRQYLEHLDSSLPETEELAAISAGDTLPSNVATNQDSLGLLIEKFNRSLADAEQSELSLDPGLAEVGAVVTAGRIWGSDAEPPLQLVQFSAPNYGLVRCTSSVVVDHAWLEEQQERFRDASTRVRKAQQRVHPAGWVPAAQTSRALSAA